MRRRFLIGILLVLVIAPPVNSQQTAKPLGKDQVREFVKVGMETPKLVKVIQEHGIDFDPTDDDLAALRKAGAQDAVIQALRAARPKPLTKDQVLGLVAQDVPPARAAMLVKQRGVDFLADDAYLETLRLAGGTDELTAAVREATVRATVPIRQLIGHAGRVNTVAFSPDGKLLASGSRDKTAKLWDVATGTLRQTLEPQTQKYSSALSVGFSPDGKLLAIGIGDGKTTLWDVATGALKQSLSDDQPGGAWSVVFSPDGKLLALANLIDTIQVWHVATGALRETLSGHAGAVESVAFSPDGKLLASGSRDNTIKIWDVATGTLRQTLSGHDEVSCVAFSPDGKFLASGYYRRTIDLWNVATGEMTESLKVTSPGSGYTVAFSPDGKLLASGGDDRTVTIWRLKQY